MSDPSDSRVSEEGRRALERMRNAVAAAKAKGEWETDPADDDENEKFAGPFGVDSEGNVLMYSTIEEARAAASERSRRLGFTPNSGDQ